MIATVSAILAGMGARLGSYQMVVGLVDNA